MTHPQNLAPQGNSSLWSWRFFLQLKTCSQYFSSNKSQKSDLNWCNMPPPKSDLELLKCFIVLHITEEMLHLQRKHRTFFIYSMQWKVCHILLFQLKHSTAQGAGYCQEFSLRKTLQITEKNATCQEINQAYQNITTIWSEISLWWAACHFWLQES